MMNQIDTQTTEAYMIEALTAMLVAETAEFSAYDVTKQARINHPTDALPHLPFNSQVVRNAMAGNGDYDVEQRTASNGSDYLCYVKIPAAQMVVQGQATTAQPIAQIPQVTGIATNWGIS